MHQLLGHEVTRYLREIALVIVLCLASSVASSQNQAKTFVLVHGAWGSVASWFPIVGLLEDQGHHVYLASLTGLGDRDHLRQFDIDLELHIEDVVRFIETRDLTDIYLVGHSYGGMVVTGAWDRLRDRVKHMVYLDAFVPNDGMSAFDYFSSEPGGVLQADDDLWGLAAEYNGWIPIFGPRNTDPSPRLHPFYTFIQPLRLRHGPLPNNIPKTFIRAIGSSQVRADTSFAETAAELKDRSDWDYYEIATGHVVMREDPEGLAAILSQLD